MGFNKVGAPTPVTSVTTNCQCSLCRKEASCTLQEGRYVCLDCTPPAVEQGVDDGKEGQDGVS